MTRWMATSVGALVLSCGSTNDATTAATDTGTSTADTGMIDSATPEDTGVRSPNSAAITVPVLPGEEKTVCIYIRLSNPEPMFITKAVGELLPGSHHLLVYRSTEANENLNPTRCSPFAGLLSGKEILINETARAKSVMDMPKGVGLKIEANQMLKLEAHYINTTKTTLSGKGIITFDTLPASTPGMIEANGYFWGTTKLKIPPKTTWDTGVKFQAGLAGTKAFFMTTHQHRFGTKMTLWPSTTAMDTSAPPLVEEQNWAEPNMFLVEPHFAFDGTSGISWKCEYNNTSDTEVLFGESAFQEMCFTFGWYYPSKVYDVCLDGICLNRK